MKEIGSARTYNLIIGGIILVMVAILLVGALLIKGVFTEKPPQSPAERELIIAQDEVNRNPASIAAHLGLGEAYYALGRYDEAIEEFEKSIELATKLKPKKYPIPYYHLGLAYQAKGDEKEAIKNFEKVFEILPKYAPARFELGKIYLEKKDYPKALENFKNCVEGDPTIADYHYCLGLTYEKMGEKEKAIASYNEALRFVPDYNLAIEGLKRLEK